MATLVLPACWVPAGDTGETFWQGTPRSNSLLQKLGGQKFFGALGQVPTKRWLPHYTYDASEPNLWSPTADNRNANTLQLLEHSKFFGALGQVPTKWWAQSYNYDVGESNLWSPALDNRCSNTLQLLDHQKFFGAPGQVPTTEWSPYLDYDVAEPIWLRPPTGLPLSLTPTAVNPMFMPPLWVPNPYSGESFWVGQPVGRARTLVATTSPVTPPPWKFSHDAESVWRGPLPDNANPIPLLTEQKFYGVGGQVPTVDWDLSFDSGETFWVGSPRVANENLLIKQNNPFSPPPWKFRYDADSFWQGAPLNADPIVFLTAQKFFGAGGQAPAKLWRYDYNVGESFWQGGNPSAADPIPLLTEQKFFGAGGQAPTKLWRYDHDVGESFWVGRPTPKGQQLVATSATSFFSPLWVPDVDVGETFWVGKSTAHSPGLTVVSFAASPFWIPDPENSETFWVGKPVAKIQELTANVTPFAGALWIPDSDVGESFWLGKPVAKIEALVVTATTPFKNYPLGSRPSDDGSWSPVLGYNQSLTGSLVVARGSFYSPRPGDVPDWVGVPTAKPEALVPPAARTTPFANYPFISRLVDDPTWYGSPTSNQTLALPTTVARAAFFYPKPSFDQDWQYVGRVNLQAYTPGPPIPPPAAYAFFSPLWVPDIDTGEAFWQGRPVGKNPNFIAAGVVNFAGALWIPDLDVGESFWLGSSLRKPEALVPGQQFAASPLWIPDSDVGESFWLGHALASSLSIRTVTKEPFIYLPWKFGQDDASYWVGTPSGSQILVRTVTKEPFIYVPWKFGQDDASGWQSGSKTKNLNLSIEPFVNLPWQWKFNYDDPSSWQGKSTASQLIVPTLVTKPFIYRPWEFGQDDASGWQYGSRARNPNLVTIVEPFVNPPFRFGYDDSSGWQFYSRRSGLLIPILTVGGQIKNKTWLFNLVDDPPRNIPSPFNINISKPPPVVKLVGTNWLYGTNPDDAPAWQGFYWRNNAIIFPPPTLITDPRFVTYPRKSQLAPWIGGAARLLVTSPPPRKFVTTPTSRFPSMPYGNDFSVIDPTVEKATFTFNFDPWLALGETITAIVSVTVTNAEKSLSQDANPQNIVVGSPQIGPVPPAFPGTLPGNANRAVLQQFGNCQVNTIYLTQCLVMTSNNQTLNLAAHLPCGQLQ